MLGRAAEIAVLQRTLHAVATGSGRSAQIIGEPGIGKSRLIAELCDLAAAENFLVLIGRAAELESDVPYGVVVDALDDYLGSLTESQLKALCGSREQQLTSVFPALGGPSREDPTVERERYWAHRAVRTMLERLATRRPVLLVLDDVHWADEASLELLSFLARRPTRSPTLLVTAWRPGHAPGLVERLAGPGGGIDTVRLELPPLTEDEATELLGEAVSGDTRRALYHDSGGNPFYLTQLARVADHDRLSTTSPTPPGSASRRESPSTSQRGVPDAVARAVHIELDSLSPTARLVAQSASVVAELFDPALVAGCADLTEQETLAQLDTLLSVGTVRPTKDPRRFRFRHPIVRRAVYDSASRGWRLGAHARAAEALDAAGTPASVRAHHLALSAKPGDQAAIDTLLEAARHVRTSAPATAAHWLGAALALLPSNAPADAQLQVLVPLAMAEGACGRLQAAGVSVGRILTLLPDDGAIRIPLIAQLSQIERGLGHFPEARALLVKGLEAASDAPAGARAVLELELGLADLFDLDYVNAGRWATTAAEHTVDVKPALHATAVAATAFVHCCDEDVVAAIATCEEAARLVDDLDDERLARRLDAAYYLGCAEWQLGRLADAERHLGRVDSIDGGAGRAIVPVAKKERSRVLATLGRLSEASELAEVAVDTARLSGSDWLAAFTLAAQAEVLTVAGELDAAAALVDEAAGLTPAPADQFRLGLLRHLALIRLEEGDHAAAKALLVAGGAPDFAVVEPGTRCAVLETNLRVELAAGNRKAAMRAGERIEAIAERSELALDRCRSARCRARLHMADGQPLEATTYAAEAAVRAAGIGAVMEEAASLVLAGEAHISAGRAADAVAPLRRAEALLATSGALRRRDKVAQELRRLGVRQTSRRRAGRPGPGVAALSGREREVADLVTAGMTNREIAAALFISDKTVETHLARVFSKLGVTSRASVAGTIERSRAGAPGT